MIEELKIENMIYEVRGKQVMLDSDVDILISLKIVDVFINTKKYISNNLMEQNYYNKMTVRHNFEIKVL